MAQPLSVATERRLLTASLLTPARLCAVCRQDAEPESFTPSNLCVKCEKAGAYLRAAVAGPDALRRLADDLEDAVSERHEVAAAYRLARIVDALSAQVEAVAEVAEAIAARRRSGRWPTLPFCGFGLFERGVWKAPWMGPAGEIVLVAVSAARHLIGRPFTVPLGGDHVGAVDRLLARLERQDPLDVT